MTIQREIYSHYCRILLEEKNDIVLLLSKLVESITGYLEETGISIKKYRKNGSILTIRSIEKFFGSGADFLGFLDIIEKQIHSMGKNGISIITEIGSLKGDIKEVIDYEMFITSTSDIKPHPYYAYIMQETSVCFQKIKRKYYLDNIIKR